MYKIIRKLKVCVSHTQNISSKSISLIVKSSDQSTAKNLHTTYINTYTQTTYYLCIMPLIEKPSTDIQTG